MMCRNLAGPGASSVLIASPLHGVQRVHGRDARATTARVVLGAATAGIVSRCATVPVLTLLLAALFLSSPSPSPADTTVPLKGRLVKMGNRNQAVFLSADDLTSNAIAAGVMKATDAAYLRAVRLKVRITNFADQPTTPVEVVLLDAAGRVLKAPPEISVKMNDVPADAFKSQPELRAKGAQDDPRYYLLAPEEIAGAVVAIRNPPYLMTLPLPRLIELTTVEELK